MDERWWPLPLSLVVGARVQLAGYGHRPQHPHKIGAFVFLHGIAVAHSNNRESKKHQMDESDPKKRTAVAHHSHSETNRGHGETGDRRYRRYP